MKTSCQPGKIIAALGRINPDWPAMPRLALLLALLRVIVPRALAPAGRGECWIATGLGAEPTVTDAGTIRRTRVIPRPRERNHAGAVAAAVEGPAEHFVEAAGQEAGGRPAGRRPLVDVPDEDEGGAVPWILGGAAGLAGAGGGSSVGGSGRTGGGGGGSY